jgi:hypothetical protein
MISSKPENANNNSKAFQTWLNAIVNDPLPKPKRREAYPIGFFETAILTGLGFAGLVLTTAGFGIVYGVKGLLR